MDMLDLVSNLQDHPEDLTRRYPPEERPGAQAHPPAGGGRTLDDYYLQKNTDTPLDRRCVYYTLQELYARMFPEKGRIPDDAKAAREELFSVFPFLASCEKAGENEKPTDHFFVDMVESGVSSLSA